MKTAILGSILNHAYAHESRRPEQVWLTQPVGGGQVVDITWRQALDQARRMAAHLRARGLERGERVAMLAGNSAHFAIAELATWIAGGTMVAVQPTETVEHIRGVLEDSAARVLFVGKLDDWPRQRSAVPAGLQCIALPLGPLLQEARAAPGVVGRVLGRSSQGGQPGGQGSVDGQPWLRWDDIVARTPPQEGRPGRSNDEVATILYGAGANGHLEPVMHTFGGITRVAQALVDEQIERDRGQRLQGRMLSHLPLAHYFERSRLLWSAIAGGRTQIFFVERAATFFDDMRRARPTLLLSVPQQWIDWQQAVLAQMPAAQLEVLLADAATAPAVRAQVLESLGLDAVRCAVTGAVPLPPPLMAWWRRMGLNPAARPVPAEDFASSHHAPCEDAAAALGESRPEPSGFEAPVNPAATAPLEFKPAMPFAMAAMAHA